MMVNSRFFSLCDISHKIFCFCQKQSHINLCIIVSLERFVNFVLFLLPGCNVKDA